MPNRPKQESRDGKFFWAFPELPFDVQEQVSTIYDFYMRTDPTTGDVNHKQWAVYPNNSTPKNLLILIAFLEKVTAQNSVALASLVSEGAKFIAADQAYWEARLAFYRAKLEELAAIAPDQMLGVQNNEVSHALAHDVVEPLFLGWYPEHTAPFSQQPAPYGHQMAQSVLDLYMPFSIANRLAITSHAMADAFDAFKTDLSDNAGKVLKPLAGALNVLPYVVALAIGVGIFTWVRK